MLLERRSAQPLTPLWVFADRNRGGAYMIQALVGGALFGMFFLTTLFLQHVLGYSPLKAGAAFVPATVVMMGAAGAMSRLVNRIGVRPLVATGTAIAAAGMWWLSHLHLHAGYLTGVMLPLMVLSVGLGLTFVPLTLTAVSGVKEEHCVDHRHPDRRFHRRRRARHRRRHYRPPPRRSCRRRGPRRRLHPGLPGRGGHHRPRRPPRPGFPAAAPRRPAGGPAPPPSDPVVPGLSDSDRTP